MTEKEFNFIEEIRNNPRIVKESDLQKMEYIELSYTGELIPVEEVEVKFGEFIKIVGEDVDKIDFDEIDRKQKRHERFDHLVFKEIKQILRKRAGEKLVGDLK